MRWGGGERVCVSLRSGNIGCVAEQMQNGTVYHELSGELETK